MYMNYYPFLLSNSLMKKILMHTLLLNIIFSTANIAYAHGKLEVICGPMFAGKSEELIRRVFRAYIAQQTVLVVKPAIDTRSAHNVITSHSGKTYHAHTISTPQELLDLVEKGHPTEGDYHVIAIDEAQFFSQDIMPVIRTLIAQGKRVIIAGLDLDHRSEPFGPIPQILALADSITKLQAICILCGQDAYRSQRIINGQPARYDDPIIMIGAEESYQPRCKNCFKIE